MWLALIGVAVLALAHTAPFPFLLEYASPGRSIWQGPPGPHGPAVFLTFDDGPNPDATPALLDALAETGARATFFLIREHVTPETAPIVRRAAAEGHALALHTGSRAPMLKDPGSLAAWLDESADHVEALTAARPCRLFRPHAGWRGGAMYDGLERAGYRLAGWGFAMWDFNWWRAPRPEQLAQRLSRRASDGSIIVMHDGHHKDPRPNRQRTVTATRLLVPALRARGFGFATLCDLVAPEVE